LRATPSANRCALTLADCHPICSRDGHFFNCSISLNDCIPNPDGGEPFVYSGAITVDCATCPGTIGRRPNGLACGTARSSGGANAVGTYFAAIARLEAASVAAFCHLEKDLAEHGAPEELIALARRSARDEARHARVTTRIAKRFGAEPVRPKIARRRSRSLESVVRENVVEGCVRETFGALLATVQAARAADPETRRELARIAEDETDHAALSWAIAEWGLAKLDRAARKRIERARVRATRELEAENARELDPAILRAAGLPTAPQRVAFVRMLAA
jgi:hypothetical protein